MRAPEFIGVDGGGQLFDGAVVRDALKILGKDGDGAVLDGGVDQVGGVDQKHPLLRFHEKLRRLRRFRGGRLRQGQLAHQDFQALDRRGLRFDHFFGALDGFGDARFVEGLEDVVDGVNVEGLDGVIVEGGGKNDLRQALFAFEKLFDHAEAVEAGHLDVEEDQVRVVLFDQGEGFEAVLALGDDVHLGKAFEQEREFVARRPFVVNDDSVHGHAGRLERVYAAREGAATGCVHGRGRLARWRVWGRIFAPFC